MFLKFVSSKKICFNLTFLISYFCLFLSMIISSLLNQNGAFTFTPYILTAIIIFFYLFFSTFREIRYLTKYVIFLSLALFLAVFIFTYREKLLSRDFYRLGDLFGDQNEIAMFMALGTCLCLYFIFFENNKLFKIISCLIIFFYIYCGFSTGSKLFLVTVLGCSVFIIFLLCGKKWWLAIMILLGVVIFIIFLLSLPAFESYRERILNFFNFFSPSSSDNFDYSTYERLQMFFAGLQMFGNKPIFGFGTLGFSQLSSFGKGCHNTIAQMLCNYGIIGSIFFFYPFFKSFILFYKSNNKKKNILSFILILFFVLTMFSLYLDIQKIYAFIIPVAFSELFSDDYDNFFVINNPIHIKYKNTIKSNQDDLQKKKICFVVSNFGLGGPQEFVKNLSITLDSEKFDIHIVSMFDVVNEKYKKFINSNPHISFHFLNKKKGYISLKFILQMKEIFDDIEPDFFSTHTSSLPYVAILNKFSKRKIIHTIHSLPEKDQSKFSRFLIKRQVMNKQITFIGCSKTISILATQLYKVLVEYINNGIFLTSEIRKETKYTFFTLGRLVEMKRIDLILNAFNQINIDGKYSLAIIGDGPEKNKLIELVNTNKIKNVSFLGEVSNVNEVLSISNVHLMASEWEANPLSILESMSYGIPTIATNVGGVSDSVNNGYNGFLYDKNDLDALKCLMIEILNKDIYDRLSLNCLETIKQYDISNITKKYEQIFKGKINYE